MTNIAKVRYRVTELEYRDASGCMELRLYLLGLLRDIWKQYQQADDKTSVKGHVRVFKELEKLYKSLTALTLNPTTNRRAQFEFAKALMADKLEKLWMEQVRSVA